MKLENEKKTADPSFKSNDPWLIVPKMLYFLLNWFIYSTHAFFVQYLKTYWKLNLDVVNVSYALQFITLFTSAFWGQLADRTKSYRQIAAFCVIMNCLLITLLAFPPTELMSKFWLQIYFIVLNTLVAVFSSGTFPIIDAIVLSILEADPSAGKDAYGAQKLAGALSHNICSKVIHYAYDAMAEDFFVMFYSAIFSMFALVVTLLYLVSDKIKIKAHKHHGPAKKDTDAAEETNKPTVLGLFFKPEFTLFLFVVLCAGIVRCVNTNNHSVYLTDILYLNKADVSDLMLWRIPIEGLLLFYSKRLMQWMGPYWFLILGQFTGIVRMFLYSVVRPDHANKYPDYIFMVIIEMLKGANSSLIGSGAFRIASDIAPASLQATAQTLVAGTWQGLSMSVSAIMAFLILSDSDKIRDLFTYTTIMGFVSFVLIFCYYAFIKRNLFTKVAPPSKA